MYIKRIVSLFFRTTRQLKALEEKYRENLSQVKTLQLEQQCMKSMPDA